MTDELFDIVDENNHVIGQALRSVVHRTGLWHRGMNICLFTRDGKLLTQQRSQNKDKFPSALDCSVSEHVQRGEEYAQTAARGLREELGIAGIELRRLLEFRMEHGDHDNEISQLFEGSVDPNTVHFDPVEIDHIAYYTLNELLAMLNARQTRFSPWFEQLVLWYLDQPNTIHARKIFNPKSV